MIIIFGKLLYNDHILRYFCEFFKILIFDFLGCWGGGGVKWQKMAQKKKKICPACFISQEPYILWLSFMLHLCKMIISPGSYFISSKFWFFGLLGSKRAKNSPKWQEILSIALHISGTMHHMTAIYGTHL